MFDDFHQDRPLPERARKGLIVGAVVLLIVIGGVTLIRDVFTDDGGEQDEQAAPPQPEPETTDAPEQESGTGGADTGRVEDWFPHTPQEFAQAGSTAEDFLSAVATIDYDNDNFDEHADALSEWTEDTHADTLGSPSGIAHGVWRILGQDEEVTAWTGQAEVERVLRHDAESVDFLLSLEATPLRGDGEVQDLGSYRVITVDDGGWTIEFSEPHTS